MLKLKSSNSNCSVPLSWIYEKVRSKLGNDSQSLKILIFSYEMLRDRIKIQRKENTCVVQYVLSFISI